MNKNILVVLSHLDDEIYVLGLMLKLKEEGYNIHFLTICGKGLLKDNKEDQLHRINNYYNIINNHFTSDILDYNDLTLTYNTRHDDEFIKEKINHLINKHEIDTVVTHYYNDMHSDHKKVSELVRVVCRPYVSRVKKLLGCYIPGNHQELNNFNTVVDISANIELITTYAHNYNRLRHLPGYNNSAYFADNRAVELYHLYYEKL